MKQKWMQYKKIIICACTAAVVVAVAAIVLLTKKEETYRSILVYDVMGSAVIERESVGAMNAAENLYLESGDRVSVASDSGMRMKLDDDKYVMAEADTVFSVEAEGTDADSRTRISLEQGAITNEIRNPLSEGSLYETSTPNSVMAVRGTIYRVELYADENGEQNTKLCCFDGKVGTKPILPDGTYGEEVLVPAGSELTVYQDGTLGEVRDIAYEELPGQAVENLIDLMKDGQSLTGISLDELTQFTLETEDIGETAEGEREQTQQPETELAEKSETEETVFESEADPEADAQVHTKTKTAVEEKSARPPQPSAEQPAPMPKKPEAKPAVKPAAPVNGDHTDNGNNGDEGSPDKDPEDDSDEDKPDEDKPDKDKENKDKPSKPKTYTVTFMYQGEVFATQNVKRGQKAAAPVLAPDQTGGWDFDFRTKIKADTTVLWKNDV